MKELVRGKLCVVGKFSLTVRTDKDGFPVGVEQVHPQGTKIGVFFFCAVTHLVYFQIACLIAGFITTRSLVGLFLRVSSQVNFQQIGTAEFFVAMWAGKALFFRFFCVVDGFRTLLRMS